MSRAAARLSRVSAPATNAQKTARAFTPTSTPFTSKPELRREKDGDGDELTLDEEKSGQDEDLLQQLDQVLFPFFGNHFGESKFHYK